MEEDSSIPNPRLRLVPRGVGEEKHSAGPGPLTEAKFDPEKTLSHFCGRDDKRDQGKERASAALSDNRYMAASDTSAVGPARALDPRFPGAHRSKFIHSVPVAPPSAGSIAWTSQSWYQLGGRKDNPGYRPAPPHPGHLPYKE